MAGSTNSGEVNQKTLAVANDALTVPCLNCGTVGFQLTGTWSGTITFEASLDGATWVAVKADNSAGTAATTATGNDIYTLPCAGFSQVRARFSTATSGTVVATSNACVAPRST